MIVDEDRGETSTRIRAGNFPSVTAWSLFCTDGDGHAVRLDGQEVFRAKDLLEAQKIADQRLAIEFRRLNPS